MNVEEIISLWTVMHRHKRAKVLFAAVTAIQIFLFRILRMRFVVEVLVMRFSNQSFCKCIVCYAKQNRPPTAVKYNVKIEEVEFHFLRPLQPILGRRFTLDLITFISMDLFCCDVDLSHSLNMQIIHTHIKTRAAIDSGTT